MLRTAYATALLLFVAAGCREAESHGTPEATLEHDRQGNFARVVAGASGQWFLEPNSEATPDLLELGSPLTVSFKALPANEQQDEITLPMGIVTLSGNQKSIQLFVYGVTGLEILPEQLRKAGPQVTVHCAEALSPIGLPTGRVGWVTWFEALAGQQQLSISISSTPQIIGGEQVSPAGSERYRRHS
jgi:hypothetical protein